VAREVPAVLSPSGFGLLIVPMLAFSHECLRDGLESHSGTVRVLEGVPEGTFGPDATPLGHKILQNVKDNSHPGSEEEDAQTLYFEKSSFSLFQ